MVRTDGDTVRLRQNNVFLAFAVAVYLLPTAAFSLIGLDAVVHAAIKWNLAYALVGGGAVISGAVLIAYMWHMRYWAEAFEATPTELRVMRGSTVLHRLERDLIGATRFVVGDDRSTTGKHALKVYDHEGQLLAEWRVRLGYDAVVTKPFYEASGVPGPQLLRELYQRQR